MNERPICDGKWVNTNLAGFALVHTDIEILIAKASVLLLSMPDWNTMLESKQVIVKNKDEGEWGTFVKMTTTEDEFEFCDVAKIEDALEDVYTSIFETALKLGNSAK